MTNSDFIEQTRLLVARTQQGDHKSFAQLYDMYVNQLFNFGLRLTTDRELLKDCIHDVFVKIYVKREELSEVVNFRSYLFISLMQPHLSSFYTASPVQPIPAQSTFRRGVIQYTIEWHSVYGFTRKSMWFHSMLKAISSTIKQ